MGPTWMFMNLHKTADAAPTEDDDTLLIRCPRRQEIFRYWLYAGVRYCYRGKLEGAVSYGAVRFQSELDALLDSDSIVHET